GGGARGGGGGGAGGGAGEGGAGGGGGGGVSASLSLWTSPLTRFASLRKGSARKSTSPRTRGEVAQAACELPVSRHAICDSPAARGERWSTRRVMCKHHARQARRVRGSSVGWVERQRNPS